MELCTVGHRLMREPSRPQLLCQATDGVTLNYLNPPTTDVWKCFLLYGRMVDYSRYYSHVDEASCCMFPRNPRLITASDVLYSD